MDQLPPMFAVLIGINNYEKYEPLQRAAGDARKIKKFLIEKFKTPSENITLLTDSEAKREKIIAELSSLKDKAQRNNAILFFFSGYAGRAKVDGSDTSVGVICPVDMNEELGILPITCGTLVQLFDATAKACGNNITAFMDCSSETFTWGNPSSFVVVAPKNASETQDGGPFTNSLLNVLGSQKHPITVQSLADKIQADMAGVVQCCGQNIDCILFHTPSSKRAHYAFISGHTENNGDIILAAGFAQGIQNHAIYAIYASHIPDDWNTCLGYLIVESVKTTRATLVFRKEGRNFSLPTVFYAVEASCPYSTVSIFFDNCSPDVTAIKPSPSWEKVETSKDAHITLGFKEGKILILWNGIKDDPDVIRNIDPNTMFALPINKWDNPMKMVRKIARFTHHISRLSPSNSIVSPGLQVQLQEVVVDTDFTEKPSGKDILGGREVVTLTIGKNDPPPLCLVLTNNNAFPVWPYVFVCDANFFEISPWYSPQPGTTKAPLQPKSELIVGCGDEPGLQYSLEPTTSASEISYIKIFATVEPAESFSSLMQRPYYSIEDGLREDYGTHCQLAPASGTEATSESRSPNYMSFRDKTKAKWAAMRITIVQKYPEAKLKPW